MPKSAAMEATDPNIMTLFWSVIPMAMVLLGTAVGLITANVVDKLRGGAQATRNKEEADPGSIKIDIESPSTPESQDSSEESGWAVNHSYHSIEYVPLDRSYFPF